MNGQNYLNKANQLHFEGKLYEAIELYKTAINMGPTVEAYSFLAWAYSQLGRNAEAIEELKKAIELDDNFGPAYNDIGTNLYNLEKYDDAVEYFKTAITKMDLENQYIPYFNIGQVYEKNYQWHFAIKYYSIANELKPDYELAKTAMNRMHEYLN